jgi:hypothetical protein
MRIIQGVGYPRQNKSHFKSTDLWLSGATEILPTIILKADGALYGTVLQ